jgi:hypothetical protein
LFGSVLSRRCASTFPAAAAFSYHSFAF